MRKKRAPETQNLVAALKSKMAKKGARPDAIVTQFIKQYPEVIARENLDLVNIAIRRIVGQVDATPSHRRSTAQFELFSEFAVEEVVLFRQPDGSTVYRELQSLTISEGRTHVEDRTKPRARVSPEVIELGRLIDTVEPHEPAAGSTIGQCWTEFQKAQKG